jgi:DnaJ-class molecular chaperone
LPRSGVDDAAALGGEVEVPTIDGGRSRVKVPEGSQSGRQMRLRGKGMPALRGTGMGDMYIELAVETPVKPQRRAEGIAAPVRGKLRQVEQPRRQRLLRQGAQVLGRSGKLTVGPQTPQVRPISQAAITAMFRISFAVETFDAI